MKIKIMIMKSIRHYSIMVQKHVPFLFDLDPIIVEEYLNPDHIFE